MQGNAGLLAEQVIQWLRLPGMISQNGPSDLEAQAVTLEWC